jgi:hypothetical protein
MMIFPETPIAIGTIAVAHFVGIEKVPPYLVGRFRLQPDDSIEFTDRVGALQGHFGLRYEPIFGTWASFVIPEDRDDVDLLVGLDTRFGRAMVEAGEDLHIHPPSLLSEATVRSLALGYFASARS